jgi:hypothetical protein
MRTKSPNIDRREIIHSFQLKRSFLGRKDSPKQVLQLLDRDVSFSKLRSIKRDVTVESKLLSLDEFKVFSI